MSSTRSGGLRRGHWPARWRSLYFMVSSSDRLRVEGKQVYLGKFATAEEAMLARAARPCAAGRQLSRLDTHKTQLHNISLSHILSPRPHKEPCTKIARAGTCSFLPISYRGVRFIYFSALSTAFPRRDSCVSGPVCAREMRRVRGLRPASLSAATFVYSRYVYPSGSSLTLINESCCLTPSGTYARGGSELRLRRDVRRAPRAPQSPPSPRQRAATPPPRCAARPSSTSPRRGAAPRSPRCAASAAGSEAQPASRTRGISARGRHAWASVLTYDRRSRPPAIEWLARCR